MYKRKRPGDVDRLLKSKGVEAMCSNLGKLKTVLFLYVAVASFAAVLEAAPQFYPTIYEHDQDRYDRRTHTTDPQDSRRFVRQPELFNGYKIGDQQSGEIFAIDDRGQMNEDFYDFERRPRDEEALPKMKNSIPETIYVKPEMIRHPQAGKMLYVVRGGDYISGKNDEDDYSFSKKSARNLNAFPISMMKHESSQTNAGRSLTDEQLGRIVRKAITAAKYGDSENPLIRKVPQSVRKSFRDSDAAVYRPRIYRHENVADVRRMTPQKIEEIDNRFANDQSFESEDNEALIIGGTQNIEVHPVITADVSFNETEPETYKFVDGIEEESGDNVEEKRIDDVIEGDVILTEIEEDVEKKAEKAKDDELHDADDAIVEDLPTTTETPISTTEDYENPAVDFARDFNLPDAGDDQRPATTTEAPLTDEARDE